MDRADDDGALDGTGDRAHEPAPGPALYEGPAVDDAARSYVADIRPEHRPLFDRVHRLVLQAHPDARTTVSYSMPTYVVGPARLYVGVWKHGLSFYGWRAGQDAGFADRHPDLVGSKGTIRLSPEVAADVDDGELRDFVRAALTP